MTRPKIWPRWRIDRAVAGDPGEHWFLDMGEEHEDHLCASVHRPPGEDAVWNVCMWYSSGDGEPFVKYQPATGGSSFLDEHDIIGGTAATAELAALAAQRFLTEIARGIAAARSRGPR